MRADGGLAQGGQVGDLMGADGGLAQGGQVGDLMGADGGLEQNGGCRGGEKDRGLGYSLC